MVPSHHSSLSEVACKMHLKKKKKGEMATYSELYRQVKNRANKFMPTENLVQ